MSDLVQRLRQGSDDIDEANAYCDKAADRIEALEAALREIADALDKATYGHRVALAPEQDK